MPKSIRPKVMSVEGLVWNAGRYLTILRGKEVAHAPGMLAFPGGGVELHAERVENALEENVRREVMEESGVELQDEMHYLESTGFINDEGMPSLHVTFLCRYKSGEARHRQPAGGGCGGLANCR